MDERPLDGGNSNTVVRAGETVRRIPGSWTPAVHALLRTLRDAGMTEVPEPHGFDEQGREVLSFLPGRVGNYPLPDWLWAPVILDDAGALLRRMHDASVSLVGQDLAWGSPRRESAEVICHNDFAPYNMTFADGRVAGVFDFDAASPGPRLWDLAYLAYRLAPLTEDAETEFTDEQLVARIERLIEAYGKPYELADLLETLTNRLLDLAAYTDQRLLDTDDPSFAEHAAMYRRDAARAQSLRSSLSLG
ncbi:MAG: aminoglycoside phosphotransferase family protein, partial [Microbacterium sp.]